MALPPQMKPVLTLSNNLGVGVYEPNPHLAQKYFHELSRSWTSRSFTQLVQAYALLWPYWRHTRGNGGDYFIPDDQFDTRGKQLKTLMAEYQAAWVERLGELFHLRWLKGKTPEATTAKFEKMVLCPPSFFTVQRWRPWTCNHTHLCPHCWCRRIRLQCALIEMLCFGGSRKTACRKQSAYRIWTCNITPKVSAALAEFAIRRNKNDPRSGLTGLPPGHRLRLANQDQLIALKIEQNRWRTPKPTPLVARPPYVGDVVAGIRARFTQFSRLGALAMSQQGALDYVPRQYEDEMLHFDLNIQQLWITPRDWEPPSKLCLPNWHWHDWGRPARGRLMRICGHHFRYPLQYLKRPPADVAYLLGVLDEVSRLQITYGQLNGITQEKLDALRSKPKRRRVATPQRAAVRRRTRVHSTLGDRCPSPVVRGRRRLCRPNPAGTIVSDGTQ